MTGQKKNSNAQPFVPDGPADLSATYGVYASTNKSSAVICE